MAQINPKITIRSVYFGMLLLSAAVMILTVRLTVASEVVDALKANAEQGDASAQFLMGYMYDTGKGAAPQNYTEAVQWYRMAAEQGDAAAQTNLGRLYFTGRGVPKDVVEAARLFRLAAEQGHAEAQYKLGLLYALGQGVPKDDVQAYAWVNIGVAQIGDEESGKSLEVIAEDMTASAITKAQNLSREYWEAYGPNRASSE